MTSSTKEQADLLRQEIMKTACEKGMGHIAPSLSCLDILVVLYHNFPKDIVILSKGHGCYGIYALKGQWGKGCLDGFGSLGHGLPIAVGLALGYRLLNKDRHVFCIVGDGELQEGSMWEALNVMQHYKLKNITIIVDNNGLQAMDRVENILSHDLVKRFEAWGLDTCVCDGHNHDKLNYLLKFKPQVIIANTVKGKGFKFMENTPKWHYRIPDEQR